MKFLTLENGRLGALIDDTVVDIGAAGKALSVPPVADTLEALVHAGDEAAQAVWTLAQQARTAGCACRLFSEVRLQARGAPATDYFYQGHHGCDCTG
jgi:hypothetical protein